jgi:hypothetical protein
MLPQFANPLARVLDIAGQFPGLSFLDGDHGHHCRTFFGSN